MCEPVSIGLGIGAATGLLQQQAANQQGAAQRSANQTQADIKTEELRQQAGTQIADRMRLARRERSRATAAAAEGGVGGQSFALQIKQSLFDADIDAGRVNKNLALNTRAVGTELASANASTAQGTRLDFLTAGMSGASSGLQLGGQIKTAFPGK